MATQPPPPPPERVPWSQLRPNFLAHFEQGQHIAVIGPTGEGKTTLAIDLLTAFHEEGGSCVVLANKPRDATLDKLVAAGWMRTKSWPPDYEQRVNRRVIVWPQYGRASQAKLNRPVFEAALDGIMREGKWFVYVDETTYFVEQMGMRHLLDEYWNAARSSKITLIAGAQRPAWINRTMTSQESWLFAFRPRDIEDRDTMAKVAGDKAIREEFGLLKRHEFLIVDTLTQTRYISRIGT